MVFCGCVGTTYRVIVVLRAISPREEGEGEEEERESERGGKCCKFRWHHTRRREM